MSASSDDEIEEMKWIVVHFTEEESVEVVPKKWYIASIGKSYWPGSDTNVPEAIKKCFSARRNWPTYPVKVLGEYDDFNEASRKVVKAKTSDVLTSDNNYVALKKRKLIKKKLRYSCSSNQCSSEDDVLYPEAPKKILKSKQKNTISNTHKRHTPDGRYKNLNEPINEVNKFCSYSQESNLLSNENPNIMSNLSDVASSKNNQNSSVLINRNEEITGFNSHISPQVRGSRSQIQSGGANTPVTSETGFQKQVFKLLHTLNYKIDNLQADVNIILKRNGPVETRKNDTIVNIIKGMPFNTKEDLDNLETLTDVEIKMLSEEFSLIGGDTVNEATKTLMYRSLSNNLGSMYTWEGSKTKNAFKTLKLAQAIIVAVRLNPKTTNASECDIIKTIKAWLLRAKERHENSQKKRQV